MLNSPFHKVAHYMEFHICLFSEALSGKHWKKDDWLSGLIFQSNCAVLTMYRQLGNYLIGGGQIYGLRAQHICQALYKSMFDTYQQVTYSLKPRTAQFTESWCQSVVCTFKKQRLAGVDTLAKSPACSMPQHLQECLETYVP